MRKFYRTTGTSILYGNESETECESNYCVNGRFKKPDFCKIFMNTAAMNPPAKAVINWGVDITIINLSGIS